MRNGYTLGKVFEEAPAPTPKVRKAYCSSEHCNYSARIKKSSWNPKLILKDNVSKHASECPDCNSFLVWKIESIKKFVPKKKDLAGV